MNFPIDMVYLWCNGNDPAFKQRKQDLLGCSNISYNNESSGDIRFTDNEELRFSLRSLEKNAPWIHHIFIVTDRQRPHWLRENSRLTIVDHSEILPPHLIPCFNSSTIEKYIYRIPHLAEHFLYGNDDMFFGDLLSPDFFFTHSGQAITRVYKKERYNHIDFNQISHQDNGLWLNSIINSWKVLYDFHHQFHPFVPYHNIDAYTKTGFQRTWHRFENKLLNSDSAFRNSNDIERIIFDLDAIYSGTSIIKILPNLSPWKQYVATLVACSIDGMVKDDKPKHLLMVQYIHPKLFCINSAEHSTSKEKRYARKWYKKMFPVPSPFECPN